jgi:hypothetical protein
MKFMRKLGSRLRRHYDLPNRLETIQEALGRIESRLQQVQPPSDPKLWEFKVYSQWGEDGILEYLTQRIPIPQRVFVEFGVEDYTEANTLFLLKHRYWRGLVIDGSPQNIESIERGRVFWKYDLRADCSFITRDNINDIISRNGIGGDIGLLSVDIDGNDYWVWEAITCISPRIVVSEYNSLFGPSAKVSVPYDPGFRREAVHPSKMFYGASISALAHLAAQRGYSLVAGNSAGNNVFFVRNDCLGAVRPQSPEEAYVRAPFREARSADGAVQLLEFPERQAAIAHLPVVDVVSGKQLPLKDVL